MMMPRRAQRARPHLAEHASSLLGLAEQGRLARLGLAEAAARALGLAEQAWIDAARILARPNPETLAACRAAIERLPAHERPKYRRLLAEVFPRAASTGGEP